MLDLSAVFSTMDHTVLVESMSAMGLRDQALVWFQPYLANRSQRVFIGGHSSGDSELVYGFLPASVLGSILFAIHNKPIGHLIMSPVRPWLSSVSDDSQLYVSFRANSREDPDRILTRIKLCILGIKTFMSWRRLCLNYAKTGTRWLCCHHLQTATNSARQRYRSVAAWLHRCPPRVTLMSSSTATSKWNNTSLQSAERHTFRCMQLLVSAPPWLRVQRPHWHWHWLCMVISKLDYGNCLLYDLPDRLLRRLQLVQNSAARMGCRGEDEWSYHSCPAWSALAAHPTAHRVGIQGSVSCLQSTARWCPSIPRGCAVALPTSDTLAIGKWK